MRTILEDLYYGNITPCEQQMIPGSELKRAVDRVAKYENQLMEQIGETEQETLTKLIRSQHEINSITASLTDIQMVLAPVFAAYGISHAVLFGSVAKGTATEKSDLDLLVDSKLQGLKFVGFMEAVRQAVGMPVDIFDVRHIEKDSKIDREICSTGVTIYEK